MVKNLLAFFGEDLYVIYVLSEDFLYVFLCYWSFSCILTFLIHAFMGFVSVCYSMSVFPMLFLFPLY